MASLNNIELKVLASAIHSFFHRQDIPPADEIRVPVETIRQGYVDDNVYFASVQFITNYCSRRIHNIKIKFNVDSKGRFIPRSFRYA